MLLDFLKKKYSIMIWVKKGYQIHIPASDLLKEKKRVKLEEKNIRSCSSLLSTVFGPTIMQRFPRISKLAKKIT